LNHSAQKRREQGRDFSGSSSIDAESSALYVFKSLGGSIGIRTNLETKRFDLEERRSGREAEAQSKRLKLEEERAQRAAQMESRRIELEERRLLLETESNQQQASLTKPLEGIESDMASFATGQSQQIKLLENQ
jgi:hypothetical protein